MSQSLPGQTAASPRATQGGLGDLLRRAREERRWTIADCAARLRIRAPYLAALEAGQYDQLPGLTYCVGFVKTYAEFLDLDGPEMVQRFKAEAAGLPLQPSLTLPSPAPVGRIPGGGPLAIAVLGLVAVIGGWVFLAEDPRSLEIRIPDLPERFAAMVQPRATPLPTATAAITASPPDISVQPPAAASPSAASPSAASPSAAAPSAAAPSQLSPPPGPAAPTAPPPVAQAPAAPAPAPDP
ncbi:MAG: helix-turn-helix domain-containing protein, partial [Elsteraceae bacterium]